MWAIDAELVDLIVEQLAKRFGLPISKTVAPEPVYEPPFVPEKPKKNETHMEMMQRRNRDLVRSGKAVSANMMRHVPCPPRRPGQQMLNNCGLWSWWS